MLLHIFTTFFNTSSLFFLVVLISQQLLLKPSSVVVVAPMVDVGGEEQHGGDLFHGLQLHSVDIDLAERREKEDGVKERSSAEGEEEEVLEDVYGDLKYAEGAEVLQPLLQSTPLELGEKSSGKFTPFITEEGISKQSTKNGSRQQQQQLPPEDSAPMKAFDVFNSVLAAVSLIEMAILALLLLLSHWDSLVALVTCNRKGLFKLNIDDYAAVSHHKEGGSGPGGPGGPGDSLFQRNLRTLAVGLMSGELFDGGDKTEDDHLQGRSLEEGASSSSQSSAVGDDSAVKKKKEEPLIEKGGKVKVIEVDDDKSSSKQLSSLKPAPTTTTTSSSSSASPDQDDGITTEEELSPPPGLNSNDLFTHTAPSFASAVIEAF